MNCVENHEDADNDVHFVVVAFATELGHCKMGKEGEKRVCKRTIRESKAI